MEKTIKISELPVSESLAGFSAVGVSATNSTVQVPMSFVQQAADNATTATAQATAAKEQTETATQAATEATQNARAATTAADEATQGVDQAKDAALDAAKSVDQAKAQAQEATTAANEATSQANAKAALAQEAATTATNQAALARQKAIEASTAAYEANTAAQTIDSKIALKLDAPTSNATSIATITSIVGQTSEGVSVKVSKRQIAEMAGLDHCQLTEQNIPGEFWRDLGGYRRQVLTRTIWVNLPSGYTPDATGRINALDSSTFGVESVQSLINIEGCRVDNDFFTNDNAYQDDIRNVVTARLQGRNWGRFVAFYGTAYSRPCTIIIKLTYTRY